MEENRYGIKKYDNTIKQDYNSITPFDFNYNNCIFTYQNILRGNVIITRRRIKGKSFGIRIEKKIYGKK